MELLPAFWNVFFFFGSSRMLMLSYLQCRTCVYHETKTNNNLDNRKHDTHLLSKEFLSLAVSKKTNHLDVSRRVRGSGDQLTEQENSTETTPRLLSWRIWPRPSLYSRVRLSGTWFWELLQYLISRVMSSFTKTRHYAQSWIGFSYTVLTDRYLCYLPILLVLDLVANKEMPPQVFGNEMWGFITRELIFGVTFT